LVGLWSWGLLSPQTLQTIASKAKEDLLSHAAGTLDFREIERLAEIGAEGRYTQNSLRDLERRLSKPKLEEARLTFDCTLKSPVCRYVVASHPQDVLLPHVLFHVLHRDYPDEFADKITGAPGEIERFWKEQEGSRLLRGHPLTTRPRWQQTTVPLAVHGDGTPVSGLGKGWSKMMDGYSFVSLLGQGATRDLMMLLFAGMQALMTKNSSRQLWRILAWSFEALSRGVFPVTDAFGQPFPVGTKDYIRAGKPLAGGYAGVVWCVEGDLDYFAKNLWLNHWSSAHPCPWCPCNKMEGDGMCWSEFREGRAEWQGECWSNPEWLEANTDRHPLLSLPGVGIENCFPDLMHTKHGGCDKYNYASVIHILCFEIMPDDPATNLDVIWAECVQYCKTRGIRNRYRAMKPSLVWKVRAPHANYPKMRGKMAEIRNIGEPLLHVWNTRSDRANLKHQQIAFMLRCSVKIESMLRDNRHCYRYPPDLADEFLQTTERYLQLTSSLARQYADSGRQLFDVTTKHHILWHCAKSAELLNPCRSWCYMGEDNMQHLRKLAASSLAGTKPACVGAKVLRKWLRGFTLRFLPRSGWFGAS